ncbi:exosome complex component 10-like isoform X2 [Petromyzon marinus]|uniref:exosome complex component 10-like isoform X2 n=1 Tax=Petromyzon marinus TaxID=7757 RepID=UPI003F7137D0
MLMKIAEEMPRELQGVLACCNPVPPLLRQNSNELWQLVKQARLVPLIKSETPIKAPSRTFITRAERLENPLFCAHDGLSLDDRQPITRHGTEVEGARRAVPATRPVLTLFDDSEEQQNEARTAQSSTSQMKAARVLQTFVNRFGMHHSYRSFLGITCLMQISMREEDFIIDTLMLRDDLHILNEAFTNPNIVKVFHGADSDIEWLQRDLGLPLLPDMLHYARADTHYLLYVYDRVRADLLTKALGRPNLLQLVWDQSRTVALKRYHKPVFTEDSYLKLLHKHKQPLDVQQSSAARLLYAWRDRTARAEDESTGYVLPNHMLMKIAEEMPRELQGVLACCNPVPPLVRQNANELWQLVKQARLVPLIKRLENPLFCPHDGLSLDDRQPITRHGTEVEGARRAVPATRPVLTLIDDSEEQQNEARTAQSSTSQMKAARVLQTFVNPFGMYLPSSDGKSLPFQEKKLDPNSKVFEICSRWKLMKAPEKPKKSSAQPAKAKHAEKKMKVERPQEEPVAVPTVREQKQGATRREAPGAAEVTEVGGKRQRADSASLPAPPLVPDDFTPHEYTEADAHIFTAGCSRGRDQNRHTTRQDKHKLCGRGQGGRTVFRGSARGMTYMQGHSGRLEIPLPSPTSPYVHSRVFCVRVGPCISKCLPHVSLCVPVGRRMSKCVRTCLCNVPPSLG